jgi:hypothetical protein
MEHFEPEPVDTLKSEHLVEGVRPIVACVGTEEEFRSELAEIKNIESVGQRVDFFMNQDNSDRFELSNNFDVTHIISAIDDRSKFTENLYLCTSVLAVGCDKKNERKNISFLTHQNPGYFLLESRFDFISDLKAKLIELKDTCAEGTIDLVITGGQLFESYEESIRTLSAAVKDVFGFEPVVIAGPKVRGCDNIYFDNDNRRLYIVRPKSSSHTFNDSFSASGVEDAVKKMKKRLGNEEAKKESNL